MGWLWIAVPVVVLALAALLDRRAASGHRVRSAASMDQALGDRADRYQQSAEQQMNQQRTAWSLARWLGGGS